jgi:hypothetical protein
MTEFHCSVLRSSNATAGALVPALSPYRERQIALRAIAHHAAPVESSFQTLNLNAVTGRGEFFLYFKPSGHALVCLRLVR